MKIATNFLKNFFYKSIFKEQIELQHHIAKLVTLENSSSRGSSNNLLLLEFGVFKGSSINIFSNYFKKINYQIYGFDSFEGINEDWYGTSKTIKSFDNFGKIPKVNSNVVIVKRLIQDTLPEFLKKNKEKKIVFIHMDLDTYESSRFVLEQVKPYLKKSCIILFDEIYNFPGWSVGEYKALTDTFKENEYSFFAFSSNGSGAAIRIN